MTINNLAYRSSITTSAIKRGLSGLETGIKNSQKSSNSISKSLLKRNDQKRQAMSVKSSLFLKRREAVRRREQEDIVEASSVSGSVRRSQRVIMNSTKGFMGRILDYIGTLLVGWTLINLPTIISFAKELGTRIQKLTGILSTFMSDTKDFMMGFGQLLGGVFQNVISFDFTDSQGRLSGALNEMRQSFERMENSIYAAIDILTEPIDFGIPDNADDITKDDDSSSGQQPSAPPPTGTGLPDPQSAEMYRIAAALSTEGTGKQSSVDMMQVVVNRKAMGYGKTYTAILAAGRSVDSCQFQGVWKRPGGPNAFRKIQTLEDASKWSGQSKNTLLGIIKNIQDPGLQANAAKFVGGATEFRGSPATVRAVNSDSNPKNNIQADANGIIPGSVWRGGNGDNQFLTSNPPGADRTTLRPGGAAPFNLPAPQAPSSRPSPGQFTPIREGQDLKAMTGAKNVDYVTASSPYGMREDPFTGMQKMHGGIDIAAPAGTYIALKIDSEVVFAGWQNPNNKREGYGQVIDLWVEELGVQLRFGHCQGFLITSGKVKAGRSFARVGDTGRSRGPHIHFEYDTTKGRGNYGGVGDPSAYVPYILLTNTSNTSSVSTPANTSQAQLTSANIESAESKERKLKAETKDNIITVPLPSSQQRNTPMPLSGGQPGMDIMIDDSLNRFMIQKLLLDLAYT